MAVSLAAGFAACSASNDTSQFGGGGSGGNTGTGAGTTGDGGFGFGGSQLDGSTCPNGCSADLKKVLDCNGNLISECTGDQGCASGSCIDDPCLAAEQSKSSYGCDYWSLETDLIPEGAGACFAAFLANTWTVPVHIDVEYNGQSLPTSAFTYIPQGQGQALTYTPYDSAAGLAPGQVAILFDNVMTSLPNIKAGKVKGVAISSSSRSPLVPDLPTVAESGLPGFQSLVWFGLLGPANTPKAVVDRVNAEMNKALQLSDIQARFSQLGFESAGGSAADFAQAIQRDAQKWSKVIKDAGVKAE